jgi:DNA-binding response OmpR family regulator
MASPLCPHCAELQEQLAYYRAELEGRPSDVSVIAGQLLLRPSDARALLRLYASKGRVVSHAQLMEAVPTELPDRSLEGVKGRIYRLRRALGQPAILTVWGEGYRLSQGAMNRIRDLLPQTPLAA